MEEIMEQIAIYHKWSKGCLAGMILSGIVTGFLYWKLRIKDVIRFMRRRKKRIGMFLLAAVGMAILSGNPVMAAQIESETEGIIDFPPEIRAFRVLPGNAEDEFTTEDEVLYYVKNLKDLPDLKISIQLWDEPELFDPTSVCVTYRQAGTEEWIQIVDETAEWTSLEDGLFEITYGFDGMADVSAAYEFQCSYTDITGQNVTHVLSQKFVLDKVVPRFETLLTSETGEALASSEDGKSLNPYYNAAKEIQWSFQAFEENLDMEQTCVVIGARDRNGELIKQDFVELENQSFQKILKEDGHYKIQVKLVDRSGNEAVYEKEFALDYTAPEEAEITYRLENGNFLSRMIHQLTFGYFAKEKVIARITVEDAVSGVDKMTYTYEDVENKETLTKSIEPLESEENKTLFYTDVELPYSFKGNLKVYNVDKMGNASLEQKDIGVIAESEDTHGKMSKASLEIPVTSIKKNNYFNTDVPVDFLVQDIYSGIAKISYTAGIELQETVSYVEETEIVTEQVEKSYTISAAANEGNNISLGLAFTDNAGHTTTLTEHELPVIHIDVTKPVITVSYDNNDAANEKYYKEERIATIKVIEQNFDPEDVKFSIEGPEVEIGAWHHKEDWWQCSVRFYQDGEYSFGFSCTDLAGNTGTYENVDKFVIDQTVPILHVAYDNNEVKNNIYYNAPRTATITVKEKNFSESDVQIFLHTDEERKPVISPWRSSGELHQANIYYDYDGAFSFGMEFTDLAGNEAASYGEDSFVVDLTKPEIQISEVADQSANQGIVSPLVQVTDVNYLENSAWIEIMGANNGKVKVEQNRVKLIDGEAVRIQDFEHRETVDDKYQLSVGGEDLAGNRASAAITFSVNRHGSVYTFDPYTEQLVKDYYTTKEMSLSVTETNADTLIFHEILCSLNGKLKTLQPGIDYTITETGDATSWKQYRYEIKAQNFVEEGHYKVTIYSKDCAGNLSNNQSKGKDLAFAVDKTPPSILVAGVEQNGRYRENTREIIVNVEDNVTMKEAILYLDENRYVFDSQKIQESDGKLSLTVPGKNTWQTLRVESIDMAGNESESESVRFLVTPNIWVQFYHQKPLFYGVMACLGLIIIKILILRKP